MSLACSAGLEAVEHLDRDGEIGEPLAERPPVLDGQHRRRHEHRHLLAGLDGLERRPHRQLGLAVADVAAQEPVHGDGLLHVGLDLADGADLVRRLLVRERLLELHLPVANPRSKAMPPMAWRLAWTSSSSAARSRTDSATFSFCFCHLLVPTLLSVGRLGLVPMYFCTRAMFWTATWILTLSAYSIVRYSALPRALPLRLAGILPAIRGRDALDSRTRCLGAQELADAVGDVHDVLARLQVGQRIHRRGRAGRPLPPAQGILPEQLVVADDDGVERLDDEALWT